MYPNVSLQLTLASQVTNIQASAALAIPITISIRNPAEAPVTLLTWNSPLDSHAGVLGVFEIRDLGNGKTIEIDTIKVSRKLPATPDDLVEIPAGQTVERIVKLPSFQSEEGHEYSIRAQGVWHAIWDMPLTDVTASQLTNLTGAVRGEFQSNTALVKLN